MINRVVLVGRITKDPELKYTSTSNIAFVQFTLAVNRTYSKDGQREADFINCVVWRQQAENLARFIKKGALLGVEGSIQVRSYDDANGQRRTATDVVCESIQFLEPKGTSYRQDNNNPFDDMAKEDFSRRDNRSYQSNQNTPKQSFQNTSSQGDVNKQANKPKSHESFDDIFGNSKENQDNGKDAFDDLSGDFNISNDDLPF